MLNRKRGLLYLVLLSIPLAALARGANERTIIDIQACFDTYNAEVNDTDNTYNGNYGTNPDWDEWNDGLLAASRHLDQCLADTIGVAAETLTTFDFAHAPGAGTPDAVIYHFDNGFPAGEQVYLTVFNAGGTGGIADGTISLNGTPVVGPADLSGIDALERPVTLAPGQNELRIDVATGETGALFMIVDTRGFAPPN